MYKPFNAFGRGITLLRGLTITMVMNHLLNGMILQVVKIFTYGGFDSPSPKEELLISTLWESEYGCIISSPIFFWGGANANKTQIKSNKSDYIFTLLIIRCIRIYIYIYIYICTNEFGTHISIQNPLVGIAWFFHLPPKQIMHVFPSHMKTIRWNHHAFFPG